MRGAGGILCEPVARLVEDGSPAASALGLVRILAEAGRLRARCSRRRNTS